MTFTKAFQRRGLHATRRAAGTGYGHGRYALVAGTSVAIAAGIVVSISGKDRALQLDSDNNPNVRSLAYERRPSKGEHLRKLDRTTIDQRLNAGAESHVVDTRSGIYRYDVAQLASNQPCEDEHTEVQLPVPSGIWSFFAVMDGHSGGETSKWLRENLIPAVAGALADLYGAVSRQCSYVSLPEADIEKNIKATFLRLDDDIVNDAVERALASESKEAAVQLLAPAYAGSCALLAFYESDSRILRVAITGDSRAILGRRVQDANGRTRYEVRLLSTEQDGHNVAEEYRLNAEHLGEVVVKNGRVLSMGPSRAFGDARYKWGRDVQARLKRTYLGRSIFPDVKTPPYLTAEPELTMTKIKPGDFMIMASDGLWESLSSEDAVGLVGWWLEGKHDTSTKEPKHLPVVADEESLEGPSVRYRQWNTKQRFVNVDSNAATHLIRNALGGSDQDLLAALLSMGSARSRVYRDDITATVVFFNDESDSSNGSTAVPTQSS
ncbi:protein serine/threonine phosphatase 2C [Punctularia strigosozonata HHB-11173 SS5]|uniref:protein serine/threonine phosphatase 2C n=1 Tax=Punctularia strigosozonata (strain HHB-11173) TaxID=741275 RepID=UPI0004416A92|nr:protein serine/threonine phosphatase 2C [Punctularia strigosozonata HHB-11173 SS5]EIN07900.1 protein serine/threonine phosphatase 2C [Punctularia strigosozonata HHB-11173 SS5]